MTTETKDIEQQGQDEASDADLEAGFYSVRGGQPAPQVTPDPAPAAAPEHEPEAGSPAPADGVVTEEPAKPAVDENAELRTRIESLTATVRNLAGNMGGLKSEIQREVQKLASIQNSQPQGSAAASDAKRATQLLLKRVRENWPDFADDLAADLEESMGAAKAASAIDDAEFDRRVGSVTERVRSEMAAETLDLVMPDWRDRISMRDNKGNVIVDGSGKRMSSAEFGAFLAGKGDEYAKKFWSTNSPAFIVNAIKEFEGGSTDAQVPDDKQARLRAAVVPKGRSAPAQQPALDEEAAMERGFANVRGRR